MADNTTRGRSADRKRLNKSEPYEMAYAKSDRASPERKALMTKSSSSAGTSSRAGKSGAAKKSAGAARSSEGSASKSGASAKKSAKKSGSAAKKSTSVAGRSSSGGARKSASASARRAGKSASPAMKRTNAAPAAKKSRTTTRTAPKPPKAEKTAENTAPKTMREADAVDLLTDDHLEVDALFKQYERLARKEAPAEQRRTLAQTICDMLKAHTTIEEEIFYPAARRAGIDADLLDEADIEHASAKDLIAQIEGGDPDDDKYDAKVKVLGEYITHHVVEEHTEMFGQCRRSGMDLVALRGELEARKLALVPAASDDDSADEAANDGKGKSTGLLASLFSKT
ncbi:MAG TPA: hemerythrin domain-containing protein [Caldimonas sp.]|nr:hemerythrin domain-containing protein [Caldimonas sp.]